ncbi:MAG: hypothetical protein IPK80_12910 [Nannocystis sp.]|nr:hypothetical protein [Nannocystis sp.]
MRSGALFLALSIAALVSPACRTSKSSATPGECAGACGKGTRCDGSQCVVDYSQDICGGNSYSDEPAPDMLPAIDNWGSCDRDPKKLPKFAPVDDSGISELDPNKTMVLDMNAGAEKLRDDVLMAEMRKIEYEINKCMGVAACYSGGHLGGGEMKISFRLLGNGSVESVSITAAEPLTVFGIIPCARMAVFQHAFPRFNGQHMVVKYTIELE